MRNLKRALSLALSTVMLMGMMVVGSGAAGYDDVSSEDNQEAIEVMQAVGIMTGDDAGNFNPDQQVTRGEMAVMMTKVLDLNTGNYSISAMPFVDVPAWAQSYVAAIYAEGVTGGTSATTYGTDEPVTAAQAALMLMRALGYFQYSSDFNDGWLLATIRQAGRIDLFNGIDAGAEEALTRNEVAQLVLNTLEATMVEPTGSQGVQIGDVTVGSTIKYEEISKIGSKYQAIADDSAEGSKHYVQLGEELFDGDLKKVSDDITKVDAFGAPSVVWTYKTFEGRYAQEADYTVVVTKNGKSASHWAEEADKDLEIDGITPVLNGGTFDDYKAGDVVSYYVSDDDPDKVVKIVVTRYTADVITDVDTDVRDNDAEDGVSAYITFENAGTFNDTDIAGYNASTYEEDAVVAIIEGTGDYSDEIIASYIPESVEGAISAYTNTSYTIGGTKYTKAGSIDDEVNNKVDFDEGNYRLYLDANGYVLKSEVVEGSATIRDVFYLQTVDTKNNTIYWVDTEIVRGTTTNIYYVQAVSLDGTVQELEVARAEDGVARDKAIVEYLGTLTAGFYTDEDYNCNSNTTNKDD